MRYLAADTVRDLAAWLAASGVTEGPLFRSVGKAGEIRGPLDAGDVARIFKRMALAAGLSSADATRVSGHSSRVGAAQDMVRYGVELPAVMQAGGWRTPKWWRNTLGALMQGEAVRRSWQSYRTVGEKSFCFFGS